MRTTLASLVVLFAAAASAAEPPKLKLLFLGDSGHHQPAARFRQLQPVFAARNIALTYTDKLADLNSKTLNQYDGLMVFANHERFTSPDQEKALLDYVASGKGFIPVHCASYCFINSKPYVDLVGAQFRAHQTGVFRVEAATHDHPIMKGFTSFESWDETYTHTKHNTKGRTVLEYRAERGVREPWTWVREEGKGRVFYTAWGHDQRTWSHPGFQNLLERGVRWACGQDPALAGPYIDAPKMTTITGPASDFESVPAKVPFYPAGQRWGVTAEPIPKMQKPLSPEKSVKHYSVPEGFEMKLFAADEQFGGKPIAMTWDERGRLWVAVTVDYPNEMQPEGEGRDKIVILEDTDGDGRADRVTTFADKLSIPTSLLTVYGGVVVTQPPHTLFLKDTDGDGKADLRQVLFTGWGTRDTHAGPSNLHYGFDNWIYGSVGYSGFRGEVNDERLRFGQGYYRFKLERAEAHGLQSVGLKVTKLEFLRSTNNNTWGLAFSEDGQIFGSTANGCPMVHLAIPNRYYEKVRGLSPGVLPSIALSNAFHPITDKVRQVDWHNGFTAAANCAIYTARTYPPEYWNKVAFVSDPTGHLTATFCLQPTGTDYVARYGWNLVASDDEWAAPIDAQVGPDGNVWLLDWYNFIVQHNPTPQGFKTGKGSAYETPLRDKTHGRVYRLVYTKAKPAPRVDLSDATPEKLVETLKHPNMLWRLHAQRLLVERGNKDTMPAVIKMLADRDSLAPIHAAWVLNGLGALDVEYPAAWGGVVDFATTRESPAQPAALMALPRSMAIADILANHPPAVTPQRGAEGDRVRLATLLALADCPPTRAAGSCLADFLTDPNFRPDGGLRDALAVAAAAHDVYVLAAVSASERPPTPLGEQIVRQMALNYAARSPDGAVLSLLLARLAEDRNPAVIELVLNGLAAGWPATHRPKLTLEGETAVATLLPKLPAAAQGRLLKLASTWGVKGLDAQLAEITRGLIATVADAKA
ncbi:MAG TPA: PVC-type heme-binding CxxCH protein, partial [Fimbriiglobus sp.]|nr:PVC-type heme-binding CxxCH protein [Fimbriiglobus sp.]